MEFGIVCFVGILKFGNGVLGFGLCRVMELFIGMRSENFERRGGRFLV